jgi:predicted RNase H-like HicB family nuclease
MTLNVVIESGEDGWLVVHVPALRGCVSQGRSRQEALDNIREAIEGWLEVAQEEGAPTTIGDFEIVAVAV